jgi:hypothetical protein
MRNMEEYKIDAKTSGALLSLESQCRKKPMPTTARGGSALTIMIVIMTR